VIPLEYFWDHAEALETVGLSEQAMSQENVGIVRAMLEATGPGTNREDWLDEYFDPEIEWHDTPTYPSAGVYVGREALARHAAEYEEAWADWGVEIEDIRAAGDRVVARFRYQGVGKQSGVPITGGLETPATGAVFELRGGRILRVVQFDSYDEALEAVGLSEWAMSQNVELLRLAVDATNRRDLATLDAIWSEEGEFHSTFAASEGRVFRGRQGLRDYFDTLGEVFDDMHVEIEEISEAGEDRLLVVSRVTGRGKGSGVKVEQRNGQVWTFVHGKIARIDSYMNRAEALEAAGLSE
jgi:ketosteroid isomerase-like protein